MHLNGRSCLGACELFQCECQGSFSGEQISNWGVPVQRTSGTQHTGARGSFQIPVLRLCAGCCKNNQRAAKAKAFSWGVADRHGLCWSRSLERHFPDARSQNKERSGWQEGGTHCGPTANTLALKERAMSWTSCSGHWSNSHGISPVGLCSGVSGAWCSV